jgi:class 3 adenylate cyclase
MGRGTATPLDLAVSKRRVKALIRQTALGNISVLGRTLPDADSIGLGDGRQLRAATLYADLRGFTPLVVNTPKRATLVVLDTFVSEMTRIASAFHGEVVDCAGDRILAAFWRPASDTSVQPIHDAITCGLWMQTVMYKVVIPELQLHGYKEISCGIGIDYGSVVVARVGIRNRNKLVFLGTPAVHAAKLEDIAAPGTVVVSKVVHDYRPSYLNSTNGWEFVGGPPGGTAKWYSCAQVFQGDKPPTR